MSAGIDPGAVRFSIGLEDAEDLISDAYVALDSLGLALYRQARRSRAADDQRSRRSGGTA